MVSGLIFPKVLHRETPVLQRHKLVNGPPTTPVEWLSGNLTINTSSRSVQTVMLFWSISLMIKKNENWPMKECCYGTISIVRSEEHTSELQSRENLVCSLLLEKKKNIKKQ